MVGGGRSSSRAGPRRTGALRKGRPLPAARRFPSPSRGPIGRLPPPPQPMRGAQRGRLAAIGQDALTHTRRVPSAALIGCGTGRGRAAAPTAAVRCARGVVGPVAAACCACAAPRPVPGSGPAGLGAMGRARRQPPLHRGLGGRLGAAALLRVVSEGARLWRVRPRPAPWARRSRCRRRRLLSGCAVLYVCASALAAAQAVRAPWGGGRRPAAEGPRRAALWAQFRWGGCSLYGAVNAPIRKTPVALGTPAPDTGLVFSSKQLRSLVGGGRPKAVTVPRSAAAEGLQHRDGPPGHRRRCGKAGPRRAGKAGGDPAGHAVCAAAGWPLPFPEEKAPAVAPASAFKVKICP